MVSFFVHLHSFPPAKQSQSTLNRTKSETGFVGRSDAYSPTIPPALGAFPSPRQSFKQAVVIGTFILKPSIGIVVKQSQPDLPSLLLELRTLQNIKWHNIRNRKNMNRPTGRMGKEMKQHQLYQLQNLIQVRLTSLSSTFVVLFSCCKVPFPLPNDRSTKLLTSLSSCHFKARVAWDSFKVFHCPSNGSSIQCQIVFSRRILHKYWEVRRPALQG